MTTLPAPPRPERRSVLAELLGLLVLLTGAGTILGAAFATDVRLGAAVLGAALLALGMTLVSAPADGE